MNTELLEALTILEKEKNISKEVLMEAIEQSLIQACKNHFGKADNVHVTIDHETCEFSVYADKTVVEVVEDPVMEISLSNAKMMDSKYELGDIVQVPIQSKQFGRIATQNAKNVILQKIREEERKVLYDEYFQKEKDVVTGVVQRYMGKNVSVNLGKVDAILSENEQVKGEVYKPTERIKVYVLEVKDSPKGPKIMVSRTHPELVKRLFEAEVTEVKDGIVEIKSIAREAGSRTKISVWSNDPDVDAVGACVGMNGARVNTIVEELRGEKIDIISWNENPALLIENALSPAKVITVLADPDEKTALVIVPDYQLSLAIGKEGQNARLAARLTGFKIDIKSETQAREAGDFEYYQESDDEEGEDSMEDALADVELDEEPKTEEISEETSTEEE
ncbi:MAG: transcription termination factor NusA [Oliverpabstia intestinalis]|nr:transcription termination factor NusA [Oliverpabstia intestinalis]MDY5791301.1 transcription termination factor NusA [Oliverpabstia intestinalis]